MVFKAINISLVLCSGLLLPNVLMEIYFVSRVFVYMKQHEAVETVARK